MRISIKQALIIIRNTFIMFLILEVCLGVFYLIKEKSIYNRFISLKVEAGIHPDLSSDEVKGLYDEYLELEMKWAPFVHFKHKYYQGKYNSIDSLGHRRTANNHHPKPFKIFCFGGSTMYGIGALDNTTIPSLLLKSLGEKMPDQQFKIVNFGTVGYTRHQETIQLQKELLKGNIPDLVVFYDGVNEVLSAYQNRAVGFIQNTSNRSLEFNHSKSYSKKASLLLKSSYTQRFINYLSNAVRNSNEEPLNSDLAHSIAASYKKQLFLLNGLSEIYNFKTLNILQPTIFSKEQLTDFEMTMMKKQDYLAELYTETYALIIMDSTLTKDYDFVDMSGIFDGTSANTFTDFCHTTCQGNQIIAQGLASAIERICINSLIIEP